MAGLAKPSVTGLGNEAHYTLIGGNGNNSTQDGQGLFDGKQINEASTNNVFYWVNNTTFLEIEVFSKFRIWRSGTTTWANRNQHLKIIKKEPDGTEIDYSSYHLKTSSIKDTEWELFTDVLPAGKYVFGNGFTNTDGTLRIDSEWFVEDFSYKRLTIKNPTTNQHYSLAEKTLIPLADTSSKNMILYGIEAGKEIQLDEAFDKIKVDSTIQALGSGKMFTYKFNMSERNVKKIEIKTS